MTNESQVPQPEAEGLLEKELENSSTTLPPEPTKPASWDKQAAVDWIASEPDERFKGLKQKIVDAIQLVPHTEFVQNARACLREALESIGDSDYMLLWDGKPHSSKRWLYHLLQSDFDPPPVKAGYFGKFDQIGEYKDYQGLKNGDLDTFVIFDDAIYSGAQVVERGI